MTIRVHNGPGVKSNELLVNILKNLHSEEPARQRVMFLESPGCGDKKMQALRVMLSRSRNSVKNQGRKRRYFSLHHSVHKHTEDGKRFDMVVVWKSVSNRHKMIESLEDLVGNGDVL
jgi:hypothetical protein